MLMLSSQFFLILKKTRFPTDLLRTFFLLGSAKNCNQSNRDLRDSILWKKLLISIMLLFRFGLLVLTANVSIFSFSLFTCVVINFEKISMSALTRSILFIFNLKANK